MCLGPFADVGPAPRLPSPSRQPGPPGPQITVVPGLADPASHEMRDSRIPI